MTYLVKLTTTGDTGETDDIGTVDYIARKLSEEAGRHYGASRLHRKSAIVMRDETYDGVATNLARGD